MISEKHLQVPKVTGQIEIVAKQYSNQSEPGQRAETVDKPTSNVAARPKRTSRRKATCHNGFEPEGFPSNRKSHTGSKSADPPT